MLGPWIKGRVAKTRRIALFCSGPEDAVPGRQLRRGDGAPRTAGRLLRRKFNEFGFLCNKFLRAANWG